MKPYKLVHQDLKLPQQLFLTVFQLQDTWIFKILKLEKWLQKDLHIQNKTSPIITSLFKSK